MRYVLIASSRGSLVRVRANFLAAELPVGRERVTFPRSAAKKIFLEFAQVSLLTGLVFSEGLCICFGENSPNNVLYRQTNTFFLRGVSVVY